MTISVDTERTFSRMCIYLWQKSAPNQKTELSPLADRSFLNRQTKLPNNEKSATFLTKSEPQQDYLPFTIISILYFKS